MLASPASSRDESRDRNDLLCDRRIVEVTEYKRANISPPQLSFELNAAATQMDTIYDK